jgi:hypothetical protein
MTQPTAEPTPLMAFVLAILSTLIAPTLLDRRLARLAAEEAIAAYQPTSGTELIAISQIVAFALRALDTLRLSMPEDVSLSMKLKQRGKPSRPRQHRAPDAIPPPSRDTGTQPAPSQTGTAHTASPASNRTGLGQRNASRGGKTASGTVPSRAQDRQTLD